MQIEIIDLQFQQIPQTIASYLIIGPDGPVIVETGPSSVRQQLIAGLAQYGLGIDDIKHVLLTHIHLDHAGSAGWWAQQGATIYVHYFGARHLIDPSKLIASATRIYGDQMDTLWGEILPAPAEKVVELRDGDVIHANGLQFTAIETPGHASHHHVYRLGDVAFTGDATGVRQPQYTFIDIAAPPPEFNLEQWQETIQRLVAENFSTIYPTHFGAVNTVTTYLESLSDILAAGANFIRSQIEAGKSEAEISTAYFEWNRQRALMAGVPTEALGRYETANPWHMSITGILRYWRKYHGIMIAQ